MKISQTRCMFRLRTKRRQKIIQQQNFFIQCCPLLAIVESYELMPPWLEVNLSGSVVLRLLVGGSLNQTCRANNISTATDWPATSKKEECYFEHCKSARLLQSMHLYLQLFWTLCWFLFICLRVVSVTKVIFWNSRDIFGGECPSFGHWWLPTRIPRVFGFWTNCTYSAPRGATKMKTWTNFLLIKGSGETLLWIVPEGKSSCLNLKLKEFKEFVDSFQICLDSSDECLRFNSKVFFT